jgi:enamine deaminase RidA (YjgF/YER057c/UK114 family)
MCDFPLVRNVLLSSLGNDPPAISVLAVSDLPLPEARLQIEAVAL